MKDSSQAQVSRVSSMKVAKMLIRHYCDSLSSIPSFGYAWYSLDSTRHC